MSARVARMAMGICLMASPVGAQAVGRLPDRSPYRDIEESQTLTLYSGWLRVGADPARVAPTSAPLIGLRYDFNVGSAGSIYVRSATALAERSPIDPLRSTAQRGLGTYRWPITSLDAGFNLALTGKKGFYGLVPSIGLGVGFITDGMFTEDIGGYAFGTGLAVTYGAGVRYVFSKKLSVRVEATDILHKLRYPDSYFTGNTPVLTDTRQRNFWRHNIAWQVGMQYVVFR